MSEPSPAAASYASRLEEQLWRGERLRFVAAMVLLLTAAALTALRDLIRPTGWGFLPATLSFLLILAGLESAWYWLLGRARRRSSRAVSVLVLVGAALEANFATAGILILTDNPAVGPFRALSAPMVAFYFMFLTLASIRMRPWVCVVSGAAASGGYLAVTLHTYARYTRPLDASPLDFSNHLTMAVVLLVAGLLASIVAGVIRRSVSAAIASYLQEQKLKADLAVARKIQSSLLPSQPPAVAGFEVAGRTDPADETGGDYYDWLPHPGGGAVVTLADVTGHGIGPALLAANLHAYVHAIFSGDGSLPAWMSRLNAYLAADLKDGNFATFAAALLRPSSGSVEFLSAGHGPILVYRAAARGVLSQGSHGLPLGVLDDAEFRDVTRLELAPGDMLILLTDGFIEQTSRTGEAYGIDRLKDSVLRAASRRAEEIVASLFADVQAFAAGVAQADDLTVTLIRRSG